MSSRISPPIVPVIFLDRIRFSSIEKGKLKLEYCRSPKQRLLVMIAAFSLSIFAVLFYLLEEWLLFFPIAIFYELLVLSSFYINAFKCEILFTEDSVVFSDRTYWRRTQRLRRFKGSWITINATKEIINQQRGVVHVFAGIETAYAEIKIHTIDFGEADILSKLIRECIDQTNPFD